MFGLDPNDMSGVRGCLSDPESPFLAYLGRFSVNLPGHGQIGRWAENEQKMTENRPLSGFGGHLTP